MRLTVQAACLPPNSTQEVLLEFFLQVPPGRPYDEYLIEAEAEVRWWGQSYDLAEEREQKVQDYMRGTVDPRLTLDQLMGKVNALSSSCTAKARLKRVVLTNDQYVHIATLFPKEN